jgi:TolB protein
MQKLSRLFLLFVLVAAPALAQGSRKIGEVRVDVDANTIPVRITASSPELQRLADSAFNAHGRYKRVVSGHAYELKFTAVGATQVRVDITRGSAGTPAVSETASGTTARQALLRAADIAVQKTSGLNLRGFFTARLAFVVQRGNKGEIYASDLFLGEAKQLTRDNALVLTPRWSPDGSRIIYTSYFRKGAPDIYLLDPATGRRDEFASFKGTNSGARFSPNGQQVAMTLSGQGNAEIWTSNAQGRNLSRRTRSDAVKASPCWSPDGSRIVFAMEPGPQLYVMAASGGAPQRLNVGFSYAAEPDWSRANPNKIACTVRVGGRYQIAVYDLATRTGKVVSKANFDGIEPAWLADGRHLVYTARDRSTSVLCILDTETGKSTPITPAGTSALQAGVLLGP